MFKNHGINYFCGEYSCWVCNKAIQERKKKVEYSDTFIDTWYLVTQDNIDVVLTKKGLIYRWRS